VLGTRVLIFTVPDLASPRARARQQPHTRARPTSSLNFAAPVARFLSRNTWQPPRGNRGANVREERRRRRQRWRGRAAFRLQTKLQATTHGLANECPTARRRRCGLSLSSAARLSRSSLWGGLAWSPEWRRWRARVLLFHPTSCVVLYDCPVPGLR